MDRTCCQSAFARENGMLSVPTISKLPGSNASARLASSALTRRINRWGSLMFYGLWTSERRVVRASLVSLIVAIAFLMGLATTAIAQATKKGSAKADDKSAEAGKNDEVAPQRSNTEVLIGDAVENADSPQYRKVTEAIDRFRRGQFKE